MALRNAFGDLGLDSTLQAIRDRLPAALGGTGGVKVDVGSSALPSGAATSAKQDTGNTSLSSIDGKITAVNTGAVTVSSSVLPSGAATGAKQDTGNTSLGNIDTSTAAAKTDLDTLAGTVSASKVNVNISSGGITGSKSNNAVAPGSTNLGVLPSVANAAQQSWTEGNQVSSSTDLKGNQRTRIQDAAGNDRGANVNASNQLSVSVDNTPTVTANQGGIWDIRNVSGTVSLPTNAATSTKQSDGSQKSQVVDGSGNVVGTTGNALDINIKSGNATTVTANAGTNLNTSALALDATLTGGTQQSKLTDGTNIANTVKGDGTSAGQVALQTAPSQQTQAFTFSSVTAGTTYDVGNYASVSVQVLGYYTGTTPTLTFRTSNDGTNWVNQALEISTNTSSTTAATSTTTVGVWSGALLGRYFSLNQTGAYTSGSTTGTIVFSTAPAAIRPGTQTVTGNKTNNNAVPGANNFGVLPGLANAAQQTWTEGDQVLESMDLKGNQRMRISDAAGNDRGANVSSENALATAGPTASGSSLTASPVTKGGLAKTANPTAVADGQVVNSTHDKLGKQVVVGSIRDLKVVQQTTIVSSTAETTIGTAVASTFLDLYALILTNTSASTTKVTIKDSTAGTTRASFEVPATETRGFMLNESASIPQATVNNNWTATCGTSVANLEVTALFVKNT